MRADWYPDPTGRHERRYHDGSRWTEHVADAGAVTADFEGRAQLAPPSAPGGVATAVTTGPDASSASAPHQFFTTLGADPRQRPPVRLTTVLAGFGGSFAGLSVIGLFTDSIDSGGVLAVLGIVVVGLGLAARLLPAIARHDFVRDAGTGAGIVGVVAFGAGVGAEAGDSAGLRVAQLLVALAFFGLWAAPGYRERPSFFGLGVAATVTFAASLFLDRGDDFGEYGYVDDPIEEYFGGLGDFVTRSGFVYLVLGLILLALVALADRRGFAGLGTGLAVNAIVSSVVGALLLIPEFDDAGGALLVAAVGAALGVVGALGGRRATTWIGGTMGALGVGSAVAIVFDPTSPTGTALVGFVAAALLIGAAPLARYVRANRQPPASAGHVAP